MKEKVDPALRVASVVVAVAAVGVATSSPTVRFKTESAYQIMRWLTTGAAALLVWRGALQGDKWIWGLSPVAVLFNPLAPLHFHRDTWAILDIAAALAILLAMAWMEIPGLRRKKA